MKLYFPTQPAAEQCQAEIHARMIAADPDYAASAEAGETLRWCIPSQDLDRDGKPIGTEWFVVVKTRCTGTLSPQDMARIDVRADGKTQAQIKAAQA